MDQQSKPQTGTEIMQGQFARLRQLLADMKRLLDQVSQNSIGGSAKVASLNDALFCFEIAMTFYEEANTALQAEAWFAASSIASSALESVLLVRCLLQEDDVKTVPIYQQLRKRHRDDFGSFARLLDLGKLLEIADHLSWFPENIFPKILSTILAAHLDEETLSTLIKVFEPHIGGACADQIRRYRNLLHPSVCLREGQPPSKEIGIAATFFFLVALASLAEL